MVSLVDVHWGVFIYPLLGGCCSPATISNGVSIIGMNGYNISFVIPHYNVIAFPYEVGVSSQLLLLLVDGIT